MREFLWEHSRIPAEQLRRAGGPAWIEIDASKVARESLALDPWPITASPDNFVIVVAGGGHPTNSYWLQGYSPGVVGRPIELPSAFERLLADGRARPGTSLGTRGLRQPLRRRSLHRLARHHLDDKMRVAPRRPFTHPLPTRDDQQRDHRPADRGEHVVLRVPWVALRPEESRSKIGSRQLGHHRFDDLPRPGQPELGHEGQVEQKRTAGAGEPVEGLEQRIGEEEAEGEVHDPVEVVPVEREGVLEPVAEWHLRIRVVGADGVQGEEDGDERVGSGRERHAPTPEDEGSDEGQRQDARERPVLGIQGRQTHGAPEHEIRGKQR